MASTSVQRLQVASTVPPGVGAAVRAQGLVLLRSMFPTDLMDRLRDDMDAARAREEEALGLEFLSAIGQVGYVSDLLRIGPSIIDLLDHDLLHDLLMEVFGEEVRVWVGQGIQLDPGKGRAEWPRCWHADMFDRAQLFRDPGFVFAVNFLLLVDDTSPDNGATVGLPGSHRLPDLMRTDEGYLMGQALEATAPRGSLLLIEGGAWHAAGVNRTAARRRVLKLLFTRRWIMPQIDYLALAERDLARPLSLRVRRLLECP